MTPTAHDESPRRGHCSVLINTKAEIKIKSLKKKRWNLRKANWKVFAFLTDTLSKDPPCPTGAKFQAYSAFTKLLSTADKSSIPGDRRGQCIPCWHADCKAAPKDLKNTNVNEKPAKSEVLMEVFGAKRRSR